MKYHLYWLLEQATPVNFLFFWGHQPEKDGSIGKGCLSNWWPSQFQHEGKVYENVEQWMMAQKAILFEDHESARQIMSIADPKAIKALGRGVSGFDGEIWDRHKYNIVLEGLAMKFKQDPALARYLLGTGNAVLVEASPYDKVWGIGLAESSANASKPARWEGKNLLGFALMEVRENLRISPL